jgi:hypothetical protein
MTMRYIIFFMRQKAGPSLLPVLMKEAVVREIENSLTFMDMGLVSLY